MTTAEAQGRIRFRDELLKVEEKAATAKESLLKTKGVVEVAINQRVGSLLVLFDKSKVMADHLLLRLAECLGIDPARIKAGLTRVSRTVTSRRARRIVKLGMLGAGITTLTLLAYSEKGHAIAGGIWVSLMGAHLYQNRRTLFS